MPLIACRLYSYSVEHQITKAHLMTKASSSFINVFVVFRTATVAAAERCYGIMNGFQDTFWKNSTAWEIMAPIAAAATNIAFLHSSSSVCPIAAADEITFCQY